MPFYCASCQVLHQSRAEEGSERIPGTGGEFSQDDPPVFDQRVVENSGVLKMVG